MYKDCSNYFEQAECVQALAKSSEKIRAYFARPESDVRSVCLDNITGFAQISVAQLNILHKWTIGNQEICRNVCELIGLKNGKQNDAARICYSWSQSIKLSLCLICQFQIEHLLRSVGSAVGYNSGSKGFGKFAEEFINFLGFSGDYANEILKTLKVPALIRNSLHNNGIHNATFPADACFSHTIQGVAYEFKSGTPVSCGTTEHIAHALEASLSAVKELLQRDQIQEILFLPDFFALTSSPPSERV